MYLPSHSAARRPPVLHALIHAHPLATLVRLGPDGLAAGHLPLRLEQDPALSPLAAGAGQPG